MNNTAPMTTSSPSQSFDPARKASKSGANDFIMDPSKPAENGSFKSRFAELNQAKESDGQSKRLKDKSGTRAEMERADKQLLASASTETHAKTQAQSQAKQADKAHEKQPEDASENQPTAEEPMEASASRQDTTPSAQQGADERPPAQAAFTANGQSSNNPTLDARDLDSRGPAARQMAMLQARSAMDQNTSGAQGAGATLEADAMPAPPQLDSLLNQRALATANSAPQNADMDVSRVMDSMTGPRPVGEAAGAANSRAAAAASLDSTSQSMDAPGDANAWGKALESQVKQMIQHGPRTMNIQLNPVELGRLKIRVEMKNEGTSLSITGQNQGIKELIEASLPQLRQNMRNDGMELNEVDVSVFSDNLEGFAGGFGSGTGDSGQEDGGRGFAAGGQAASELSSETEEHLARVARQMDRASESSGVDLFV